MGGQNERSSRPECQIWAGLLGVVALSFEMAWVYRRMAMNRVVWP